MSLPSRILELQRRRMPGGALDVFPRVAANRARPQHPAELQHISDRVIAGELDAAEAGDVVRDLVRRVKKAASKEAPLIP